MSTSRKPPASFRQRPGTAHANGRARLELEKPAADDDRRDSHHRHAPVSRPGVSRPAD